MTKICIIGAGAAGLAMARHAICNQAFHVEIFEKFSDLGGVWLYSDKYDGCHVMYERLRTNLPVQVMQFRDFEFVAPVEQGEQHLFPSHGAVLDYLKRYARHFKLDDHVTYNCGVERVQLVEAERWRVTLSSGESKLFDKVVVANGHYHAPRSIDFSGQNTFPGTVMHSCYYRRADKFADQCVVVVGAGPSGTDIAQELADVASRVILCSKKKVGVAIMSDVAPRKAGIDAKEGVLIERLNEDGSVLLDNGELIQNVNTIICAIGYNYYFPFFDADSGLVSVNTQIVSPLYRHLLHARHPSLAFVGIPFKVAPFRLFDNQCRYLMHVWTHPDALPPLDKRMDDERVQAEIVATLQWERHYHHCFGDRQWSYMNNLCREAGVEPVDAYVQEYYDSVREARRNDTEYRDNWRPA